MRRVCLALLALSFLFSPAAFAADTPADLPVVEQLAVDAAVDQAIDLLPPVMVDLDSMVEADAFQCPFNAPRCVSDSQCDAYCGAPGFGACQYPKRCCGCTG